MKNLPLAQIFETFTTTNQSAKAVPRRSARQPRSCSLWNPARTDQGIIVLICCLVHDVYDGAATASSNLTLKTKSLTLQTRSPAAVPA